jgi:hypothetical protein
MRPVFNVACRVGSQPKEGRRLPALRRVYTTLDAVDVRQKDARVPVDALAFIRHRGAV